MGSVTIPVAEVQVCKPQWEALVYGCCLGWTVPPVTMRDTPHLHMVSYHSVLARIP